jgi:3-methyladenine DNA glycosylase AlkD
MTAEEFMAVLAKYGNPDRVADTERFFKTEKGGYGEGDQFLAATVPNTRLVCKQFKDLPLPEIQKLLDSPIHDYRLGGVILLANQYKKADEAGRQKIFDLYLKNLRKGRVNNWDIIDLSTGFIIGQHLEKRDRALLFELAESDSLWQRRAAIISTFYFLRVGDPTTTIAIAEKLLDDKQDLIQKAVGWMLREMGKRVDRGILLEFLDKYAATMPRTTLRYAIEHLPADQRAHYMAAKTNK